MIDVIGLLVVLILWRVYNKKRDMSMLREGASLWMCLCIQDLCYGHFDLVGALSDYDKWKIEHDKEEKKRIESEKEYHKKFFRWRILRMIF